MFDIRGFYNQSWRVMNVATRPRQKEFEKIIKITGLGIILIGLTGVILSFVFNSF
jgi:protein transport protein SEC61 subunit gamma-like protein